MHTDQCPVRAFAQGVGAHRGLSSADRLPEAPCARKHAGGRLQRVQAQLAPLLRLQQNPLLIPARQQLCRQRRDRSRGLIRLRRHCTRQQPAGQHARLVEIDAHPFDERDLEPVRANNPSRVRTEPRKRRAQAHVCLPFANRRPQNAGGQVSPHRTSGQRHKGEQALGRRCQPYRSNLRCKHEAIKQQYPQPAGHNRRDPRRPLRVTGRIQTFTTVQRGCERQLDALASLARDVTAYCRVGLRIVGNWGRETTGPS